MSPPRRDINVAVIMIHWNQLNPPPPSLTITQVGIAQPRVMIKEITNGVQTDAILR